MAKKNPNEELSNLEHQYNKLMHEFRDLKSHIEQYQQILDILPEFIFGFDEDGKCLIANKSFAAVYGTTVNEMVGKFDYEFTPSSVDLKSHQAIRAKVLETGEPIYIPEIEIVDAEGNKRLAEIRRIPYANVRSGIKAVLGTAGNISERKHIEKELLAKELIEEDLKIARNIQKGLLPPNNPTIEGFELTGFNQPADATGGDYYDWLRLPDDRYVIMLADATGHGVGPALMVAVCRAYMRASHASGQSLEAVMLRVNNLLTEDMQEGRFITAVVGILNPKDKTIELYSAGHAPIFIYRADNKMIEMSDADDMPLGIVEKTKPVNSRILKLSSGDQLILITDGFYEWTNQDGEQYGIKRLKSAITSLSSKSPDNLIKGLYQYVEEFVQGTKQSDDLTAVVLKCL